MAWHRATSRGLASGSEWLFGVLSLMVGLSILAALPMLQFLSMGYLLESSARVRAVGPAARRVDRRAARRRGSAGWRSASWLSLVPPWLVGSFAGSAEMIDPGGPVGAGLAGRPGGGLTVLTCLHLPWPAPGAAGSGTSSGRSATRSGCTGGSAGRALRGGARRLLDVRRPALRLPHYFRLGLVGFLGTLAWLIVPSAS